jgi:putative non-specific serine/threonine protein kinase
MNIDFLNLLAEKLNVGSMRSIYLSVVPGRYKARLDISDLNRIDDKFTEIFFENLFTKKAFNVKIRLTNSEKNQAVERKIQYLFNENMNIFREEGISSLALGYPLLVKQNNKTKSVMKAPLFIWKLNISRSKTDMNEFIISKDENSEVEINKVLIMQLLSDDKINLSDVYNIEIQDNEKAVFSFEDIKNIIKKINEKLKIDYSDEFRIEDFPEKTEEIDKKGIDKPFIFYGGILGLFKRQNEGIIQDFNNLVENFDEYKFNVSDRDDFQLTKNSSVSTDPSQQNVIETLTDTQYKIIQGPPGTGKSQTLTAIITNALENGANILIVCEKKTALDVIYEKLSELGLTDLVAMINDPAANRKEIVKRVRDLEENVPKIEQYDESRYEYIVNEYRELKKRYNEHQSIFQKSLKSDDVLNVNDAALKYLNGKNYGKYYYVDISKNDIKNIYKILDKIDNLLSKIGSINNLKRFGKIYNKNFDKISSYEIFFDETSQTLEELKRIIIFIEENLKKYGDKFKNSFGANKLKISLFSMFNTKIREIKNAWNDIYSDTRRIDEYNNKYTDRKFTKYDYEIYGKELNEFSDILNDIVNNKMEFINFVDEKKNGKITKEEEAFINNFINFLEENGIEEKSEFLILSYYYSLLQGSTLKNEKYKDFSTNIPKLVENDKYIIDTQRYRIKKYWNDIRKRALSVMSKSENIKMLYNLRKNAKYGKINTLREIIGTDINFFKDIFPIIMTDPNTCSAVFPLKEGIFDLVVFDEASQLKLEEVLPTLMRGKYKIISGDIHQMPPSNYFGAEMEQQDISGNEEISEEDLFLADSESLLDYVNNLKEDTVMSYLDFHYRSKHPKLINFSNAAFYESRLIPMPAKKEYIPIEYFKINGVYKTRKNDDEANKIIEYIFSDKILVDGKLSSVGIVTLNLEQKNNIVNKMNVYLRENDNEETKNRYNQLIENNMFIKNLENVQGDERDIMILSTTFGKNEEGKFIQNFGPLNNQERGYKLLNVLVTRAKYKFIVFTSVPDDSINGWETEITKNGNNGRGIFYSYLAYAKAVSENDMETENRILEVLSGNKMKNTNILYEKLENQDMKIIEIIKKETEVGENDEIVKNYKIGGFTLKYAIKDRNEERAKILIDINSINDFSGETSYKSIIYRKNMFENMGYTYKLLDMANYI